MTALRFVFMAVASATAVIVLVGWAVPSDQQQRHTRAHALILAAADSIEAAADAAVAASTEPVSIARLRNALERCRAAYKRIEPLVEYLDPSFVTWYLNGAPLPKLEPKSQFIDVVAPQGFQVVDELVWTTDTADAQHHQEIRDQVARLRKACVDAAHMVRSAPWTDRMLLEACRSGVFRITALGITSFDRPGSAPYLADDAGGLATIRDVMQLFDDSASVSLAERGRSILSTETDFDTFDRAQFIRDVLDPLYRSIGAFHQRSGIESVREISPLQPIVEPFAPTMFGATTLNAAATSGLDSRRLTPELVDLGRVLFFDPALSSSAERACASCHDPARAFTDGRRKSEALHHNGTVARNAMTLVNSVFARRFFYDLRAARLSDVVAHVVTNEREFDISTIDLVRRLSSSTEYRALFAAGFDAAEADAVTFPNVAVALSAYLTTLVAVNNPVDRFLRGENVTLEPAVRRGFNLFTGKAMCASCHFLPTYAGYVPPAFVESESEILGVPVKPVLKGATLDPDPGRAAGVLRDRSAIYRFSFKTPTLRNIALTAPYMHNGAYDTLEEVVDFYNAGGGRGIGIELDHQTLPFDSLHLTTGERADLVAFLRSLTDTTGVTTRPVRLPSFNDSQLDQRPIGGVY